MSQSDLPDFNLHYAEAYLRSDEMYMYHSHREGSDSGWCEYVILYIQIYPIRVRNILEKN